LFVLNATFAELPLRADMLVIVHPPTRERHVVRRDLPRVLRARP
jgi:hypothetical protein